MQLHPAVHARPLARTVVAGILVVLCTACASVSRAGVEPIVTDRPDFTESNETVPQGMKQLEAGTTFSNSQFEETATLGEGLLRIGVARNTELRIGINSYALQRGGDASGRGFEDVSIGTKIKLLGAGGEGSWRPSVAVILASSLPTGAPMMSSGKVLPEAKLGFAWDFTSRVSLGTNFNYARSVSDFGDYNEFAAAGSLGIGITDRIGSYVEYFTFQPTRVPVAASHFLNGGFTYGMTDNLQFDARGGYGLRRIAGPDFFLGLGISRRW